MQPPSGEDWQLFKRCAPTRNTSVMSVSARMTGVVAITRARSIDVDVCWAALICTWTGLSETINFNVSQSLFLSFYYYIYLWNLILFRLCRAVLIFS